MSCIIRVANRGNVKITRDLTGLDSMNRSLPSHTRDNSRSKLTNDDLMENCSSNKL